MYVLYLDESGNPDDPADKFFVLGGAAVFERSTFFLSRELETIQSRHFPGLPPVEFHASPIRSGKDFWRNVTKAKREDLLQDIARAILRVDHPGLVLFAAAVKKTDRLYGEEAVKLATEQVCKRFDIFLTRRFREAHDTQRGLLVFAEGRYHQRAKLWVQGFRTLGTQWGILNNLSDIPYFASTRETRMLQVADYVSHAVYLLYERGDASLLKAIVGRFDQKDGRLHGIVHIADSHVGCNCPACASRRTANNFGPLIA